MRPFAFLSAWTKKLPDAAIINLATLGPIGRLPRAPGTWGAAAGTLFHLAATMHLAFSAACIVAGVLTTISVAICGEAEVRLRKHDPPEVVLDEFVAMPVCFLFIPVNDHPFGWVFLIAGFLLFRFFDIVKPLGIGLVQRIPSGAGVVLDDIAAALYTCASLHLWIRISEAF